MYDCSMQSLDESSWATTLCFLHVVPMHWIEYTSVDDELDILKFCVHCIQWAEYCDDPYEILSPTEVLSLYGKIERAWEPQSWIQW